MPGIDQGSNSKSCLTEKKKHGEAWEKNDQPQGRVKRKHAAVGLLP